MQQLFPGKTISAVCQGTTHDGHPCVLVATTAGDIVELVAIGTARLDVRMLADSDISDKED